MQKSQPADRPIGRAWLGMGRIKTQGNSKASSTEGDDMVRKVKRTRSGSSDANEIAAMTEAVEFCEGKGNKLMYRLRFCEA